ncbi:MAG: N-acetyltransferase, partial [Pseudoxanthomonas sp.]
MSSQISHDPTARRFVTQVDGQEAELVYRRDGKRLTIDHTGVPQAIAGRGI